MVSKMSAILPSSFYLAVFLGVAESIKLHTNSLEVTGESLANASVNPKYRTVRYWYDCWRKENLGPRSGAGVFEVMSYAIDVITLYCSNFTLLCTH